MVRKNNVFNKSWVWVIVTLVLVLVVLASSQRGMPVASTNKLRARKIISPTSSEYVTPMSSLPQTPRTPPKTPEIQFQQHLEMRMKRQKDADDLMYNHKDDPVRTFKLKEGIPLSPRYGPGSFLYKNPVAEDHRSAKMNRVSDGWSDDIGEQTKWLDHTAGPVAKYIFPNLGWMFFAKKHRRNINYSKIHNKHRR